MRLIQLVCIADDCQQIWALTYKLRINKRANESKILGVTLKDYQTNTRTWLRERTGV